MSTLVKFMNDEGAATSIEYGFVAALVSILCVGGAQMIGLNLNNKFIGPLSAGFH